MVAAPSSSSLSTQRRSSVSRGRAPAKCRKCATTRCLISSLLFVLTSSYVAFLARSLFRGILKQQFQHAEQELLKISDSYYYHSTTTSSSKNATHYPLGDGKTQTEMDNGVESEKANASGDETILSNSTSSPLKQQEQQQQPVVNESLSLPASTDDLSRGRGTTCDFREYPPRRYYGLMNSTRPDFLQSAEYIYGEFPIVLPPSQENGGDVRYKGKLCVNQSSWEPSSSSLPFADGTNPSLLRLDRLPLQGIFQTLRETYGAVYLSTICMTDSQCAWNDTDEERTRYNISERKQPLTVRTVLLVLNRDFETILETTILLERNVQWGNWVKPSKKADGTFALEARALDDARLFLNRDDVWISFREGKSFGYDKQIINPVRLELSNDTDHESGELSASIRASESASFCCGRNMALMQHPETKSLQSLTWADPVTVVDVNDTVHKSNSRRRLLQLEEPPSLTHRQLRGPQKRKSDFHGTNAFMLPLPSGELLGIGHFHRPPGRDKNAYARFGHHYTHAFFTITHESPHTMQRLSQEFVFPSKSHVFVDDAEIIQFASALELDEANSKLVVGYGINDCEGAVIRLDLEKLETLLRPVKEGQEVIDLMMKQVVN